MIMDDKITDLAVSDKGFTLIEVAIVLVIVGILVGLGAGLLGPLTKRAKYNESKDMVNSAVESVISYGASRNKLPITADFTSAITNPNDAWTKPLYYVVDSNLTSTALGGICGNKTTNITITICPDLTCASPTDTISDVAFIVLSGDGNYNNQTAGTQAIAAATTIKVFEVDYVVDNYAGDMNESVAYDDIVDWVGINELRGKVNCTSTALKIINSELPFTYEGNIYNASIFADGGVPFSAGGDYRWCRQESASSGLTFSPATLSADCLMLAEASWTQGNDLVISGGASPYGTYNYTFFVRDDNDSTGTDDNIAQRSLVLTVNPSAASTPAPCTNYRVKNNIGRKDHIVDATCKRVNNNSEITTPEFLNSGETIIRYNSTNTTCTTQSSTFTFVQAQAADTDGDCCVNYDSTDWLCP